MHEPADVHVLAGGYVLGALESDERRLFAEHLRSCTICEQELESLRRAATALAYATLLHLPPPRLRARLLARVRAEREDKVVPLWRTHALALSAGIATAAACAAIGLGVWTASLAGSLDRERSARQSEGRALAIVASPGTHRYALRGARGAVIVTPGRQAALVVTDLPRAPSGMTYEAWVVSEDAPRPAGTFAGGPSGSLLVLSRTVPARARVAVSVEQAGGAERLSGPMIFGAQTS